MSGDSDLEIEEAFRRAQKAHNNKAKLVASLKNRYNKVQKIYTMKHYHYKFWSQFFMLIYSRKIHYIDSIFTKKKILNVFFLSI